VRRLTNQSEQCLITWQISTELNWLIKSVWTFGDSHHFSEIDFKKVVEYSLIIRSDSCEWRCGEISYIQNRVRRGIAGRQTNIFPVEGKEGPSSSLDVWVPQGGNLWTGGSRQRRRDLWKTADRHTGRIVVKWSSFAYWSSCVHCLWLEPSLDWTKSYIWENIVPALLLLFVFMMYLFIVCMKFYA